MKKIFIGLMCFVLLSPLGCYRHINKVEHKWGPPARVEHLKDTDIYYWNFYQGRVKPGITKFDPGRITAGWIVVEITTDKNGKILDKRKYWKQPTREEQPKPTITPTPM